MNAYLISGTYKKKKHSVILVVGTNDKKSILSLSKNQNPFLKNQQIIKKL